MTGPSSPDGAAPDGAAPDLPPDLARQLEALGAGLVWRVGKDELSDDVVVRLGYASATPRFAFLPRLRSANDAEIQAALSENRLVIEWVD
ncbi:DUF3248 domain-containing protein [Deinococcus apachensis]|uniref:DUF3248 domain-containing protein n=1 Tax=Deinococcus apachensis TaxID=309886 RepID=UPI0003810B37|nr:DUF3248 domain-containing protein [Deinococcus apachensis]